MELPHLFVYEEIILEMDRAGEREARSLRSGVDKGWFADIVEADIGRGELEERATVLRRVANPQQGQKRQHPKRRVDPERRASDEGVRPVFGAGCLVNPVVDVPGPATEPDRFQAKRVSRFRSKLVLRF